MNQLIFAVIDNAQSDGQSAEIIHTNVYVKFNDVMVTEIVLMETMKMKQIAQLVTLVVILNVLIIDA